MKTSEVKAATENGGGSEPMGESPNDTENEKRTRSENETRRGDPKGNQLRPRGLSLGTLGAGTEPAEFRMSSEPLNRDLSGGATRGHGTPRGQGRLQREDSRTERIGRSTRKVER